MIETYIGLARYDENGNQSGGVPGDQLQTGVPDTTGEVAIIKLPDFLNGKNCIIYRLYDIDDADKTGEGMVKAANNPYIGVDTSNRLSIITYGVYAGKNGKPAECDNTSLARVVIRYGTGIDVGDFVNSNVHTYLDMSGLFMAAIPLTEDEVIYVGDVLVVEGDNTVGICAYGPRRVKPSPYPGGTTDYNDLENKPSINGVTVEGAKSQQDYHITGGGIPTVDGEKLVF